MQGSLQAPTQQLKTSWTRAAGLAALHLPEVATALLQPVRDVLCSPFRPCSCSCHLWLATLAALPVMSEDGFPPGCAGSSDGDYSSPALHSTSSSWARIPPAVFRQSSRYQPGPAMVGQMALCSSCLLLL